IYGVMAYYVQQHRKDISIRVALGGRAGDIIRLVVGQGMGVAAIGTLIGVVVAAGMTRLVASMLYGVRATDPVFFAATTAGLLLIALAACIIRAKRALGLQPASVLRDE